MLRLFNEYYCYEHFNSFTYLAIYTYLFLIRQDCIYVLMLRKSMAERKMRFFDYIVRRNTMEIRLMQGKVGGKQ